MNKTAVGLVLSLAYLGVFGITVWLTLFDNREGCGTLFPGLVTLPWSLPFETIHSAPLPVLAIAMLKRTPGALLNAWLIYYLFRRAARKSKCVAP